MFNLNCFGFLNLNCFSFLDQIYLDFNQILASNLELQDYQPNKSLSLGFFAIVVETLGFGFSADKF